MPEDVQSDRPAPDPLLTYRLGPGETRLEALLDAFAADPVGVDPGDREPLHDWIDIEALDHLIESARDTIRVSAWIWGHRVAITCDTVEIYEPARPDRQG